MMQSNQNIVLHLSLISGIGPATIQQLINSIGVERLGQIYTFAIQDLVACGISYDRAVKIAQGLQDHALLEQELALIEKYTISWTTIISSDYPSMLAAIEQPPVVLYYQGTYCFNQEKSIAFVGSRKADAYARVAVDRLVPDLVRQNWTIVSGGAQGVDSFVHEATVKAGGKTIAVLGSGLLHWYPTSNYRLFENIIKSQGMIISAFSLQTQPLAGNFPARNRIIAGLCQGTVVVQAAVKSGALITADFALEQGRQVFAVPGSIEHGLHDGCHTLIQQGAKLVARVDDITSEFEGLYQQLPILQEMDLSAQHQREQIVAIDALDRMILDRLLKPHSVDDLLCMIDVSLEDLMQKLFDLSLQGKVCQDMMGLWKRI